MPYTQAERDHFEANTDSVTDQYGAPIKVGDTILFPVKRGGTFNEAIVRRGVVERIDQPKPRGYGYITRALKVRAEGTNQLHTVNYSKNCIKL